MLQRICTFMIYTFLYKQNYFSSVFFSPQIFAFGLFTCDHKSFSHAYFDGFHANEFSSRISSLKLRRIADEPLTLFSDSFFDLDLFVLMIQKASYMEILFSKWKK